MFNHHLHWTEHTWIKMLQEKSLERKVSDIKAFPSLFHERTLNSRLMADQQKPLRPNAIFHTSTHYSSKATFSTWPLFALTWTPLDTKSLLKQTNSDSALLRTMDQCKNEFQHCTQMKHIYKMHHLLGHHNLFLKHFKQKSQQVSGNIFPWILFQMVWI